MKLKSPKKKLELIGWREWISLPDFGISQIKVKVDSGARTSALHATKIRYAKDEDGITWVSFVITEQISPLKHVRVTAQLIEKRWVKSSMGHATLRPVILTRISLGAETWPIEVTLINRDPMGFRMLLGRGAIKRRYLIHPARSFLQSEPREEK